MHRFRRNVDTRLPLVLKSCSFAASIIVFGRCIPVFRVLVAVVVFIKKGSSGERTKVRPAPGLFVAITYLFSPPSVNQIPIASADMRAEAEFF